MRQTINSSILIGGDPEDPVVVRCPKCQQDFNERLGRLYDTRSAICPGCKAKIEVLIRDAHGREMTTKFGPLQIKYGPRGALTASMEVYHLQLNKHRVIRGSDTPAVRSKALLQASEWNEMWDKRLAIKSQISMVERKKQEAADRTAEAQKILQAVRSVLSSTLAESKAIDWEALKDQSQFLRTKPQQPAPPPRPEQAIIPAPPSRESPSYQPNLGLLDKLIRSRRREKQRQSAARFETATREWEAERDRVMAEHASAMEAHERLIAELHEQHKRAIQEWEVERTAFLSKQKEQHEAIDAFRMQYENKETAAISKYCEMVLSNSDYPECVPREFDFDFNPANGVLVLNVRLPAPSDLPTLTEVKYVQSSDSFSEKHLSESNKSKFYDDLIYQIALRTLNELIEADRSGALHSVVLNGYVTAVDRGTGNEVTACIISVQASKQTLAGMDLSKVDAKACFRQLKGVGSSKLHSVTPVAPIVELRRDDARFIPSYEVADRLDEGYNLAAMGWEDFEHLIREIFEREFTSSGGEVRVTQASRDGGVDAVAFDPDPIRGGKIVIQAKRYAYTVGVAAVRDLYGTLMNEGATKGILVTTSDYGPDAYEFANGKPITLLNGSNLLHLLQKHGTRAHINLIEARLAMRVHAHC